MQPRSNRPITRPFRSDHQHTHTYNFEKPTECKPCLVPQRSIVNPYNRWGISRHPSIARSWRKRAKPIPSKPSITLYCVLCESDVFNPRPREALQSRGVRSRGVGTIDYSIVWRSEIAHPANNATSFPQIIN